MSGLESLASAKLPRFAGSNLRHLEIFLAGAALGAGPVHRHVLPGRAGRDALAGQSGRLVVDEAADEAHPCLELDGVFGHRREGRLTRAVKWPRILTHVQFESAPFLRRSADRAHVL